MLRELKDRSIQLLGQNWNESAYVFSRADGTPFDPDTITHAFASMIKKAGINHLRFHDLRHTHATILMEQGINPKTVAERLGHAERSDYFGYLFSCYARPSNFIAASA